METTLPEYLCHKMVRGARIADVVLDNVEDPDMGTLTLEIPNRPLYLHRVKAHRIDFHRVEIGMFFVQYEGGHETVIPAAEFEADYSRVVTGQAVTIDQIAPLAGRVWNEPMMFSTPGLPDVSSGGRLAGLDPSWTQPQAQIMVDTLGHHAHCPKRWNKQGTCTCDRKTMYARQS